MAVTIRLSRRGRHKRPFYRIVVADSKMPRDGRCIEVIGTYDPLAKPAVVQVKKERAEAWLAKGAQVSDTVGGLLRQMGLKRQMKEKKEAMEIS